MPTLNKDQQRYKKMRDQVVLQLGGRCACGFSDTRALQIDHIHGGGNDDRRKFGGRWRLFYEYVMDNPKKFQILCANCNCVKRIENSEHRTGATTFQGPSIEEHQKSLMEAGLKEMARPYLKEYERLTQGPTGTS